MIARPFPGLACGQLLGPPRRARPPFPEGSLLTHLARTAMTQVFRALGIGSGDDVLVPAFHCGVEADAARHAGARVRFYPVARSLSVDPSAIERRMDGATRAVVATHYFGLTQDLSDLASLCRGRGAALIEDCAHVFAAAPRPPGAPGSWGAASVYSLPKFLPVPDGGLLVFGGGWPPGAAPPVLHAPPRGPLARRTARLLLDHRGEGARGAARARRAVAHAGGVPPGVSVASSRTGKERRPGRYDPASSVYEASVVDAGASGWTRRAVLRLDFEAIAVTRRRNFDYLARAVTAVGGVSLPAREFPESAVPMVLPIRVGSASETADRLMRLGVGTYRLGAHLPVDSDGSDHGDARELRDTLLGLPIHQNLESAHLDGVAAALARCVA